MNENLRRALHFTAGTYLASLLVVGIYGWLGGPWKGTGMMLLGVGYMFIPALVASLLQKFEGKAPIRELGISFRFNRWFFVAWFLPVFLMLATLGVSLLLPGVHFSPGMEGLFERFKDTLTPAQIAQMRSQLARMPIHPFWLTLLQGLLAGITVNAIAAFGEELGWRGFLQKNLGFLGFWKMSFLIGAIWGIWHAPLILHGHNYPQHPVLGVGMMTLWTMLLAPLFSYVRLKSGSVIAASILHGTLNGTAGLAIMLVQGGNDLTVGLTGLAGMIVLALFDLGLFLFDRTPNIQA